MNKSYFNLPLAHLGLSLLTSIALTSPDLAFAQPKPPSQKQGALPPQNGAPPNQDFPRPDGDRPGRGAPNRRDGWGQQQGPGQGKGPGFFAALRDLNLSPEQKQQLMASRPERQEMREVVMRVKEEKQKLQEIIGKKNVSESEIQTQAAALKQALGASVDAKIKTALSLKKVLTHEQFTSFQAKMQELKGQRWQGRKQWPGSNEGPGQQDLDHDSGSDDEI